MYPYLDRPGFVRRTIMPQTDCDLLEAVAPGWTVQNIAVWSSRLNAQLRKRYGNAKNGRDALPLGQAAPVLDAVGTLPPVLVLQGRPTLGSMQIVIEVTTGGALGTAIFKWSADAGNTWTSNVTSAATVPLTGTGLTLVMPAGTYSTDNEYSADPPVPETVLQWLTILVTWDGFQKRGRNPADPLMDDLRTDRTRVLAEVEQAANSKDGLFDLPVVEDLDSAVTTGGPLFYSESSPFVSADRQEREGRFEDEAGFGTVIR